MKRKLVKQGAATLMISLPSKWVKQYGLDKGDEIDMQEKANTLIIAPDLTEKKKETNLHLASKTESFIRTLITNTYRAGYDKVEVTYENAEQFKILQSVITHNLIGFEITKKDKGKCIVENITEPSTEQFEKILSKFFLNVGGLLESTRERLGDVIDRTEEIEDFSIIEPRIIKYDNFCRRAISKKQSSIEKAEFLWAFLTLLVHAQRELYHLNHISDKKTKVSREVLELLREGKHLFENVVTAYTEKNVKLLINLHEKEKFLVYTKGYNAFEKSKGKESVALYHILSFIRQVYQANSPLIGLLT